ncbi:Spindle and kinetochore-associated protein, partial [Nymphaea thermarum]
RHIGPPPFPGVEKRSQIFPPKLLFLPGQKGNNKAVGSHRTTTRKVDTETERSAGEMDAKAAASSLESLMSSFTARISDLQELVIARNMNPGKVTPDLSNIDAAVKAMEFQVQAIKNRIREEKAVIPKAKKLVELSLNQQKKLQHMLALLPPRLPGATGTGWSAGECGMPKEKPVIDIVGKPLKLEEEPPPPKEKRGRGQAPRWHITNDELDSLSSYMRGRLTLDKVNSAINEMAVYAEANMQLVAAPRKKLSEDTLEKALELRDIGMSEAVKGKHFFLETDMKGAGLKLDNTGKAILTVLRHLGRIQEARIGHNRVIILTKP